MPNEKYNEQSEYIKHQSDCESCSDSSSDCGCIPPAGLVAVKDCKGEVIGHLTPNDAETFINGTKEVEPGFVNVYHPVTGEYLGPLAASDAMQYLEFLNEGIIPEQGTFHIAHPITSGGIVALVGTLASPGVTIDATVDRNGCKDSITLEIINQSTPGAIEFTGGAATHSIGADFASSVVGFNWSNTLTAGVHTFDLTFTACGVVRTINMEITIS